MSELTAEDIAKWQERNKEIKQAKIDKEISRRQWQKEGSFEMGEVAASERENPTGWKKPPKRVSFSTAGAATHRDSRNPEDKVIAKEGRKGRK